MNILTSHETGMNILTSHKPGMNILTSHEPGMNILTSHEPGMNILKSPLYKLKAYSCQRSCKIFKKCFQRYRLFTYTPNSEISIAIMINPNSVHSYFKFIRTSTLIRTTVAIITPNQRNFYKSNFAKCCNNYT